MTMLKTYDVKVVLRTTWIGKVHATSRKAAEQAARDAYNQEALIQLDARYVRVEAREVHP